MSALASEPPRGTRLGCVGLRATAARRAAGPRPSPAGGGSRALLYPLRRTSLAGGSAASPSSRLCFSRHGSVSARAAAPPCPLRVGRAHALADSEPVRPGKGKGIESENYHPAADPGLRHPSGRRRCRPRPNSRRRRSSCWRGKSSRRRPRHLQPRPGPAVTRTYRLLLVSSNIAPSASRHGPTQEAGDAAQAAEFSGISGSVFSEDLVEASVGLVRGPAGPRGPGSESELGTPILTSESSSRSC